MVALSLCCLFSVFIDRVIPFTPVRCEDVPLNCKVKMKVLLNLDIVISYNIYNTFS